MIMTFLPFSAAQPVKMAAAMTARKRMSDNLHA
jgi:hypothetical protein